MDRSTICGRLAAHPLFQDLEAEALADIAQYVSLQQYAPGTTIVWQGDASTTIFLMVRGLAAVTHMKSEGQPSHPLAYLMPGASFGEVGILDQQPRSATVQALTEVEVLRLSRTDFLAIMQRYAPVAIALARLLGQYLVEADRHHLQEINPTRLILIFDLGGEDGALKFGHVLAAHLAHQATPATALIAYPASDSEASESDIIPYRAGYDQLIPGSDMTLPPATQATLLADRVTRHYDNAVVVLPGAIDATSMVWLMHAQHTVLWVSSTADGSEQLRQVQRDLTPYTASGQMGVSVALATDPLDPRAEQRVDIGADYVVSVHQLPEPQASEESPVLTGEIERVVMTLIERVNHSHQLAVYVPTTVAVDRAADTTPYIERTLAFLGTRFGGATSTPARGVWQSEAVGLVREAVHVVQTYATGADLHRYLPEVLAYVKMIKTELQQEAMALEVDHQLILL